MKCNYECGFCFHTAKTSFVLPIEEAKCGLKLLVEAGMRKINFAGGEPFLEPKFLGELARYVLFQTAILTSTSSLIEVNGFRYCKEDLRMESISVVTNGSKVKEEWLKKYAKYLDIMAVSCDSFDEATNKLVGRGKGTHLDTFINLSKLCRKYNIKFKVNTVVCRYNFKEDMNAAIEKVQPFRWKCFQVLVIPGENDSSATLTVCVCLCDPSLIYRVIDKACRMPRGSSYQTRSMKASATATTNSKASCPNPTPS